MSKIQKRRFTDRELQILEKQEITCKDMRSLFGDYYDGELSLSLRLRVTDHLSCCRKCRRFASEYHQVVATAKTLQSECDSNVHNRLRLALNTRLGINLPLDPARGDQ